MTRITDPSDSLYRDEADVRTETTRVFDTCRECRRCIDLCEAFPRMFAFIDGLSVPDAGLLTPDQQDRVGDACHQCGMCAVGCPFGPGTTGPGPGRTSDDGPDAIDFPALMLRVAAMRRATGQVGLRHRWAARLLGGGRWVGALGSAVAPIVNRVLGARSGSIGRTVVSAATGVSATRLLPPFARRRFSTWFRQRPSSSGPMRRSAIVYPTCVVEYHEPRIGRDLVKVFEHNGVGCTIAGETQCCGAPLLHAGEIDAFGRRAAALARDLARALAGTDSALVVPQPTCAAVLARDYPVHAPGADADLVAERVIDPCTYLMSAGPRGLGAGELSTDFPGEVPASIACHVPCHSRLDVSSHRDGTHESARALLALTGARVTVVEGCAGLGSPWGLASERDESARAAGGRLGVSVAATGAEAVVGGCQMANTVITEHTGRGAEHPLQVLARAYGLDGD